MTLDRQQQATLSAAEKPRYQKPRYPATCEYCGQVYQVLAARMHDMPSMPRQRFCSLPCANKATAKERQVSAEQQFWSKVNKDGPTPEYAPELGPCCVWLGKPWATGYGYMSVDGKQVGAHRFSYLVHKGSIPEGLEPDHLCRNRICVNPDHLEAVTHRVNSLRGSSPSALIRRSGFCSHGHEMTPENAVTLKDGRQGCRACHRINARRALFRKKHGRNPTESEINNSPQRLHAWSKSHG